MYSVSSTTSCRKAAIIGLGHVKSENSVELQKETGATFLHPFDDEYVIAGQGTIGLEILEQLNGNVDTIICPIGGGGIIAGIAVAAKALNPNVKIIGVRQICSTAYVTWTIKHRI